MESKKFSILIVVASILVLGTMSFMKYQNFKARKAEIIALTKNKMAAVVQESSPPITQKEVKVEEPEEIEEKVIVKKKKIKRVQVIEVEDDADNEPFVPTARTKSVSKQETITLDDATETLQDLGDAKDALESLMDL